MYRWILYWLFISLEQMGNKACECDTFPGLAGRDFNLPDLKLRSSYGHLKQDEANQQAVKIIFNRHGQQNRQNKLIKRIMDTRGIFEDEHFDMTHEQTLRLVILYDTTRICAKVYNLAQKTNANSFSQLELELSYLTTLNYLFCHQITKEQLLPRLIDTEEVNNYGAYSLNLYCNGERHNVIIDDRIPTKAQSIVYLRVVKGSQLWPLLIEKAWAKQIGSYRMAKGLSPEDCFEEITGIPAYTHMVRANNRPVIIQLMQQSLEKGYWVAMVAQKGLPDIRNRQVFTLRGYSSQTRQYIVMSPFRRYTWVEWQGSSVEIDSKGQLRVKQQDFFGHFEYLVIGYWKSGYCLSSLKVECDSRKEMLFSLQVGSLQEVSIRFNQFYRGYLGKQARMGYKYSPVLMQLYKITDRYGGKQSFSLVSGCEGCSRARSGARSAHISSSIFEELDAGRYILRLMVQWEHPSTLHSGNLVTYALEDTLLRPIENVGQLYTQVYKSVVESTMRNQNSTFLSQHDLRVRVLDKKHSTIIQFGNMGQQQQKFQVDFSRSTNIMLYGQGQIDKSKVVFRVQKGQSATVELLPLNFRDPLTLQNFEVVRWKT